MAEYGDKLMASLKEAMKAKDTKRRDTIRQLQAELKQFKIDEQREPDTQEELKILQREAKKRQETISELESLDRETDEHQAELEIIESFLPEMMSREEVEKLVVEAIEATGASSMQDMGKVIGKVMGQTQGLADGSMVSAVAREKLNS